MIVMAKGKYQEWISPDGLLTIKGYARRGLSNEQIAAAIGINQNTLYEWINRYSEISEALKEGRRPRQEEIEDALEKSATGYTITKTTKVFKEGREVERKEETIYYPPNVTALIFWLKNRDPDRWKDKPEPSQDQALKVAVEILGDIGGAIC